MADTVKVKPSVLTEEMIDAAMSKRLKEMSEELGTNNQNKIRDEHNYCEEEYSSDSDYQVESVDGFSSDSHEDSESEGRKDSRVASNLSIEDKVDRVRDSLENGNTVKENSSAVSTKSSAVIGHNYSDTRVSLLNLESANVTPESGVKKGLIIKPLTNLLKADLVQNNNQDLRVFKCINGKIQLVPDSEISPAEKQKYLMYKNQYQSTKINSNMSSTQLEYFLANDLKNRKNSSSEESQHESSNDNDCNNQNSSVPVRKYAGAIQIKNSENSNTNSLHKNNKASSVINISKVDSSKPENALKLTSLLKPGINKLNNIVDPNSTATKSSTVVINRASVLPVVKDATTKSFSKSLESTDKPACDITTEYENENVINCDGDDEMTIETVTEANESSTPSIPRKAPITSSRINSSCSPIGKRTEMTQSYVNRKKILPKINYRYHTKDKLIISDKLPSSSTAVITMNGNNTNTTKPLYKLTTDSSSAKKNLMVVASDKAKNQPKLTTQSVIRMKSPPVSVNAPKYRRNVINSIITSTSTVPVNKSNALTTALSKVGTTTEKGSQLPVSNKNSIINNATDNWEKLDRFALNTERFNGESGINAMTSQILEREVPVYKPMGTNEFYPCLECGDRFVFESSLREHKLRKSVLIIYWCRSCSCCLNMYNRCMFLSHIRSHNQLFKNLDMSCLSLEPLPKHLLKLSSDVEPSSATDKLPSAASANTNVPVSSSSMETTVTSVPISLSLLTLTSSNESSLPVLSTCLSSAVTSVVNVTNTSKNTTVLDSIQKSVESEVHAVTNDSTQQKSDISSGSSNSNIINIHDDFRFNNEGQMFDNAPCSDSLTCKDILPSEDEMEITVSSVSSDKADKQESSLISGTTENAPSESTFKKLVKGRRKCPECDILITAKCSLRKHLQNFNKPLVDTLICDICKLIMQSPCALKMHLRIHTKVKPFRCPECAIEFNLFDRFMMHLKYTCCHMTKVVMYVCSMCSSMQSSASLLEQHLLVRHVRSIYKCGSCPVAFINVKSAEKHKEKEHSGRIVPTVSYQQCKLCPDKLIPKKSFLIHMKNHLNDEKVRVYAFQCPTCNTTFFQRTELVYHRMKCDSRDGIIRSVLDDCEKPKVNVGISGSRAPKKRKTNKREVEFVTPSKKQKSIHEDEIELIQEEEKDPLSLEDFKVEEPLQEPVEETCVVCKTEKVLILPGRDQSSQSLCCKKCVSPCGVPQQSDLIQRNKLMAAKLKGYKCKICNLTNSMDLKSIFVHFKKYHKEFEGQSINEWLIIENKSKTITTAETIKEKYKKKRAAAVLSSLNLVAQIKQELDVDADDYIPREKKRPKKYIKLKQKIKSEGKKFESGQIIVTEETEKEVEFSCSKCDFVGASKEEWRDHVVSHRSDPNALQCLECGECFVVLPSLEKHLIISHRITDVDQYISDNKQCMPGSSNEEEPTNSKTVDDGEGNNTCKVCYEVFESKNALDKHFRSHGMAFLFKKQ